MIQSKVWWLKDLPSRLGLTRKWEAFMIIGWGLGQEWSFKEDICFLAYKTDFW